MKKTKLSALSSEHHNAHVRKQLMVVLWQPSDLASYLRVMSR